MVTKQYRFSTLGPLDVFVRNSHPVKQSENPRFTVVHGYSHNFLMAQIDSASSLGSKISTNEHVRHPYLIQLLSPTGLMPRLVVKRGPLFGFKKPSKLSNRLNEVVVACPVYPPNSCNFPAG